MNSIPMDILGRLENQLAAQDTEFNALDQKVQHNIGTASIITAIISGFAVRTSLTDAETYGLIAILILYIINFIISLIALRLQQWDTPFEPTHDKVDEWIDKEPGVYINALINSHIAAIDQHEDVLRSKARLVSAGMILMGLSVMATLLVGISSLTHPVSTAITP